MEDSGKNRSYPMLFVMIGLALVMLVLAIQQLYVAYTYSISGHPEQAGYSTLFGLVGLVASSYMILQLRRSFTRAGKPTAEPNVKSTAECGTCGFRDIRKFREGDYVFKPSDPCPKCNATMMVTSIYYEEPKKT